MKVLAIIGLALGAIALALFVATLTGTLIWAMWDMMVEKFKMPALTWWECVKLSWICAMLFKASVSSKSAS